MTAEDKWQPNVLVQHKDGSFGLYESTEECKQIAAEKLGDDLYYQNVEVKWNNGKPLIRVGNTLYDIVDIGRK